MVLKGPDCNEEYELDNVAAVPTDMTSSQDWPVPLLRDLGVLPHKFNDVSIVACGLKIWTVYGSHSRASVKDLEQVLTWPTSQITGVLAAKALHDLVNAIKNTRTSLPSLHAFVVTTEWLAWLNCSEDWLSINIRTLVVLWSGTVPYYLPDAPKARHYCITDTAILVYRPPYVLFRRNAPPDAPHPLLWFAGFLSKDIDVDYREKLKTVSARVWADEVAIREGKLLVGGNVIHSENEAPSLPLFTFTGLPTRRKRQPKFTQVRRPGEIPVS
ncbi:hypothetical protein AURDEDRAFT_128145 [Auricularia subglabra TFB-10046 SS5]|nr:hypothetical protein AURDEDRAFT_128145 [Auricularia subglabra TFB-10046 SS5]